MKWNFWTKDEPLNAEYSEIKDQNELDFLNPELKRYYKLVRPDIPVSFAPASVQQTVTDERRRSKIGVNFQFSTYNPSEDPLGNHSLSLDGAVRLNCRELRHKYEEMMKMGFQMGKRFQYRKQLDNCFAIQKEGMQLLGYSHVISDTRRNAIASTVQRLYDEHTGEDGILTKEGQKKLKTALEDEKIQSYGKYYSVDNW